MTPRPAPLLHPSPLVIIPARNEEATVAAIVDDIRGQLRLDVLVVDDMSTDATVAAARGAGATVLPLANRLGAWGATQTGIRYAVKYGYPAAVTLDADGQHPVAALTSLLQPVLAQQADVVIGACVDRGSPLRRAAWQMFRLTGGLSIADLTSGFRCYNRRALELLASRAATLLDYQDIGVLFLLLQEGMSIREVNIAMCPRVSGHSRIFNTWLAVGEYMLLSTVLSVSKNQYRRRHKPAPR